MGEEFSSMVYAMTNYCNHFTRYSFNLCSGFNIFSNAVILHFGLWPKIPHLRLENEVVHDKTAEYCGLIQRSCHL